MGSSKNAIVLLIATLFVSCAIPILFFSEERQEHLASLVTGEWTTEQLPYVAAAIVGLFSCDILLPVPATTLCSIAGRIFGAINGSLLCWVGLNIASLIGYGAGYFFGWPAIQKFSSEDDVFAVRRQLQRYGIWPLVALRPVPVLSEASILLLGVYRYPPRQFFAAIIMANLCVATIFVTLGSWLDSKGRFWLGIVLSSAVPVFLLALWLIRFRRESRNESV